MINEEYKKELLKIEIRYNQKSIQRFDNLSFLIKGWTISLWSTLISLGFNIIHGFAIILLSCFIGVIFWMLDAFFKYYQRAFITRIQDIQDWINKKGNYDPDSNDNKEFYFLDSNFRLSRMKDKRFLCDYIKTTRFLKCIFVRNVWIVYYWIIGLGFSIGFLILISSCIALFIAIGFFIGFCLLYWYLGIKEFHETKTNLKKQFEKKQKSEETKNITCKEEEDTNANDVQNPH